MDDAIVQGGKDMSVDLRFNPDENEGLDDEQERFKHMVEKIGECCGPDGVDAVLVTLPDPSVAAGLEACKANGVRIAVFNAGLRLAKESGLLYFGQNETDAGYGAGAALARVDSTETFCCVNHAPGVDVLVERCGGIWRGA